jgi:DNA-binding CsgD family transcriptional regulator
VKAIHSIAKGSTYITPLLAEDLISVRITTDPKKPSRDTPLTSRQREVLQLLSEGKTMKEAAALLGISARTAESHKYEIMASKVLLRSSVTRFVSNWSPRDMRQALCTAPVPRADLKLIPLRLLGGPVLLLGYDAPPD